MTRTLKLTPTGRIVDVARPNPAHIELLDQAWALSQINRFTGCALRPNSVAEHSLLVVEILERELRAPPIVRLAGLHHDGHESITGDCTSPDKLILGEVWRRYEAGWARACRAAWGLADTFAQWGHLIKRADSIALATERRDLMPAHPDPWPGIDGIEPANWVNLNARERTEKSWSFWRDQFINEHHALIEQLT